MTACAHPHDPTASQCRECFTAKHVCAAPACERTASCKGLCDMHYRRLRVHGNVETRLRGGKVPAPVADRFWRFVDKSGDCWTWTGSTYPTGYGAFGLNGRIHLAHRIAYELEHGSIPVGLQIDHLCFNRLCVRGEHLEAVTQQENLRRAHVRGTSLPPEAFTGAAS